VSINFNYFNRERNFYDKEVPCECCAAILNYSGVIDQSHSAESYYRHPQTDRQHFQRLQHKGIVLSHTKGTGEVPPEDVIDEIHLGDGDTFYVRSSVKEFPHDR